MSIPKTLEQVAKQIHDSLPKGVRDLGDDVEQKIRQLMQNQLSKLDVVSREEFEVQTQVLLRSREKLNQLEKRVQQLEEQLAALRCKDSNKKKEKSEPKA